MKNRETKKRKRGLRTKGRELALQMLFSLTFIPENKINIDNKFEQFLDSFFDIKDGINPKVIQFAKELVSGVIDHVQELDKIIEEHSENWKIERIGKVELSILRLSIYEMLYRDDVPYKVAINEGIELTKIFAEEKSRNFINGILDAVGKKILNKYKDSGENEDVSKV